MNEISIYSEQIGSDISELFTSPVCNSSTIVLAPGHTQPPHSRCRKDLNLYSPFNEPVAQLGGGSYASKAVAVRSFPNAVVFNDYGIVRDAQGCFVKETLGAFRYLKSPVTSISEFSSYMLPPEVVTQGNYIYGTHGNYSVYAHFLFETMCTVHLLRSLFSVGLVSLIIPSTSQTWMNSLLDYMEIPRCSRYLLERSRTQFSNLILSSTCSDYNTFSPNPVLKDMARHFLSRWGSTSGERRRLYITREGSQNTAVREFREDAALSAALKDLGFITVNPATLPFEEQVRLFSMAEIVVGAHGSAFANLIFAPEGCKVVDILHSDWAQTGGCFTVNLTNLLRQEYVYLIADSAPIEGGLSLSLDPKIVCERVKRFLRE